MRLLQQAIRREMRLQFAASLALFFLGLYLSYSTFHSNIPLMIMGMAITLIAAKLLQHTKQVVWIYSTAVEHAPFGIHLYRRGTMYFKMADGMELSVRLPHRQLRTISKFLHRLLPHATFGYSTDRDYSFRLSPENLRRDWTDQLN